MNRNNVPELNSGYDISGTSKYWFYDSLEFGLRSDFKKGLGLEFDTANSINYILPHIKEYQKQLGYPSYIIKNPKIKILNTMWTSESKSIAEIFEYVPNNDGYLNENGSVLLEGEQYRIDTSTYENGWADILGVSVNDNWLIKIEKLVRNYNKIIPDPNGVWWELDKNKMWQCILGEDVVGLLANDIIVSQSDWVTSEGITLMIDKETSIIPSYEERSVDDEGQYDMINTRRGGSWSNIKYGRDQNKAKEISRLKIYAEYQDKREYMYISEYYDQNKRSSGWSGIIPGSSVNSKLIRLDELTSPDYSNIGNIEFEDINTDIPMLSRDKIGPDEGAPDIDGGGNLPLYINTSTRLREEDDVRRWGVSISIKRIL